MTPCILWTACICKRKGYGRRRVNGKTVWAHRWAYCQHHGIPLSAIDGLVIRHKCDVRACVNPEHLETGSEQDNTDDMVARGRQPAHSHKLTHADAAVIKAKVQAGASMRAVGRLYGVHHSSVSAIVRGVWHKCSTHPSG